VLGVFAFLNLSDFVCVIIKGEDGRGCYIEIPVAPKRNADQAKSEGMHTENNKV
jgi:hypothetical protein